MFAVSHFILAMARLIELVLWAYFWVIIARAVISWVNPDPFNPIVRFLYRVTEPVLRPIRNMMPNLGGIDISPIIVILIIIFIQEVILPNLARAFGY
jgi:YggT family protein